MSLITEGITEAGHIICSLDREFLQIVGVSLKTASISTLLATAAGVPFGVFLALTSFPGRRTVIALLHTLLSLPTVVVGLLVYSLISRQGPAGELNLLYSQTAMIIGQFILAFPIVASLSVSAASSTDSRLTKTLKSIGANRQQSFFMLLNEARFGILAAIITGFGRVFAEIGVSMMLGGNIKGYTRNITTAIALETNKGEFAMGFALGIVLLSVAFVINILLVTLQRRSK